jgi:hypothetical protein
MILSGVTAGTGETAAAATPGPYARCPAVDVPKGHL